MASAHARLDDQLCFALYAASKAVSGAYRPLLRELDLTYPQYLAMLSLWEDDGKTVKELGHALRLDSGTLSPLLQRLQAAGLVHRERQEDDERLVRIRLTDKGRATEALATPVRERVEAATGLSPSDFAQLRSSLLELEATVTAETGAG